jgi:hypothetical protein
MSISWLAVWSDVQAYFNVPEVSGVENEPSPLTPTTNAFP